MSNAFDKLELVKYLDRNVLSYFYDNTIKNITLIALALYCIFLVKQVPNDIIRYVNSIPVRIFIGVLIVYISRRHIDLAILLILAFYFTLREARGIRVINNGDLEVMEKGEEGAPIDTSVPEVPDEEENLPFHQSKNPGDVNHPAHIREDMAVYDTENMNTCVAVSDRDMCAGGLFKPSGYIANDFNNLANF